MLRNAGALVTALTLSACVTPLTPEEIAAKCDAAESFKSCEAEMLADHEARARQARLEFADRMAAVSAAMRDDPNGYGSSYGSFGTFQAQPTGFTQTCTYNTVSGRVDVSIPSTSICPISLNDAYALSGRGAGAPGATGFFRSEFVDGMNRICIYDRLGSEVRRTISAAAICPLSLP